MGTDRTAAVIPLLLRGTEVAKALGISRAQAYKWMSNGTLPTVRVAHGKTVRVPYEALQNWIRANTQQQPRDGAAA